MSRRFLERSVATLALALARSRVMLLCIAWRLARPRRSRRSRSASRASGLLGLKARGVSNDRCDSGGPAGLHADRDVDRWSPLWPAALGIALMSFTESIAAGRAFAQPGERRPDANQELLALGAGNAGRRAVRRDAGRRRHVADGGQCARRRAHARGVAGHRGDDRASCLFLAPLIELMPQATLAAVVIVTSLPLIDPRDFAAIRGVRTVEFRWAVAAMLGVIVLGTLPGILAAVDPVDGQPAAPGERSRRSTCWRASRAPMISVRCTEEHPEDEVESKACSCCGPKGRIYFANAQRVVDKIVAHVQAPMPRRWSSSTSGAVPDIEYTGAEVAHRARGVAADGPARVLRLAALNPAALAVIQRAPLGGILGEERLCSTLHKAVDASRSS